MLHTTLADLLDHLGGIPPARVRLSPLPGTATMQDVLDIDSHEDRLCELLDGVLVEKAIGFRKSVVAVAIATLIHRFVEPRRLGIISGAGGPICLAQGQVRIPDAAFFSWDRLPGRRVPYDPIPRIVPDLVAEVITPVNTQREMARKLREYLEAGVRLVWYADPDQRTVTTHTSRGATVTLHEGDELHGYDALPGFAAPVQDVFSILDATPPESS